MSSRESSFDRTIESTRLPGGGWITGVFSWFRRTPCTTPKLSRRQVTASQIDLNVGSTSSGLNNVKSEMRSPSFGGSIGPRRRTFNGVTKFASELQINHYDDNGRMSPMSVMGDGARDTEERTKRIMRYRSRSERNVFGWGRDFAISLINTCESPLWIVEFTYMYNTAHKADLFLFTAISCMPRHVYWIYTSARLTQQRLSELMS
ncbi:hypothetical protein Ciccas_005291 [Cichlidogyrus casuarinus]|uniref:Uncharacterized protein n=1 Tax=Cichlidogyrus casuarinus TaxID=1844966 RepID=A0ABD2Q9I0_9PLAT